MAKIVVITDMADGGSGYKTICIPLLSGLAKLGHQIRVAGLAYSGKEHDYPFSIIPAPTVQHAQSIACNLAFVEPVDLFLVAMDIPFQEVYFNGIQQTLKQMGVTTPVKYMAITPMENGPLTMTWAATLLNMDAVFFISEMGKQEAIKAGIIKAEHLFVGIDTDFWHPPTAEDKKRIRNGIGIADDEFVILTVADNQERKNLWAGMEAARLAKRHVEKIRYIMVTRMDNSVGWKLNDLALEMGLTKNMMFFNRGLPDKELWGLYAAADVYMQPSKAEGLGLPVMEAMACGVPCVTTDTGALHELLEGRGYLIPPEYSFRDVWGNSRRDMMHTGIAGQKLATIALGRSQEELISNALAYIRSRTWDEPVLQVHNKILEITNEQKSQP